eukprot:CAMPEP_0172668214 /NCGR_PEP_ID=MMETSP1074-20121228/8924_1 /TAXON_ID=2916 /ORGANISM="Ceratium fusus, Strain PA161109" /LENGTH=41 /DNA_ID= /DNA_START= /DNA_END= /DNA_ORIENTATION=
MGATGAIAANSHNMEGPWSDVPLTLCGSANAEVCHRAQWCD